MAGDIIYYLTRSLWMMLGIGNIALAVTADTNSAMIKVVVVMSGIVTILLSLFFGGFLKHITSHSQDREALFKELINYRKTDLCDEKHKNIERYLKEIKEIVCNSQDKKGEENPE